MLQAHQRHEISTKFPRDSIWLDSAPVAIGFDASVPDVAIAFYPEWCEPAATRSTLCWARPATPQVIDEVVQTIGRQSLPVEAIVIGGLDSYPLVSGGWPRWLTRWSRGPGPEKVIVDTNGISPRQRRRLINGTRRAIALQRSENPLTMVSDILKRWIKGRQR